MNDKSITHTCENCESPLQGRYCHECGQDSTFKLRYLSDMILAFLANTLSYESTVNRTLIPLLLLPGKIINEYLSGHRVKYISPFRLYLFCNLVFFLIVTQTLDFQDSKTNADDLLIITQEESNQPEIDLSQNDQSATSLDEQSTELSEKSDLAIREIEKTLDERESGQQENIKDNNSDLKQSVGNEVIPPDIGVDFSGKFGDSQLERDVIHYSALLAGISEEQLQQKFNGKHEWDNKAISTYFFGLLPKVMLFCLPLFALILKVFYIRNKKLYVEHLIFMAYVQSFVFCCLGVHILLKEIEGFQFLGSALNTVNYVIETILSVLVLWILVYIFLSFKNVYQQGWIKTTIKFSMISVIFFMIFILSLVLSMWWAFVVT